MALSIPFNDHNLDRAAEHRGDPGWMAEKRADESGLYLPIWRGRPLVATKGKLSEIVWLDRQRTDDVRDASNEPVFLGLHQDGRARFAFDASHLEGPEPTGPLAVGGRFEELRGVATRIAAADAGVVGHAKSLLDWHARHRFCAACGAITEPAHGGAKRQCPACATEHFPRVDPVAITLAVHGDSCLLARGPQWPEGLFSALAGFVEPGETIEAAAAREIHEEAGVYVKNVRILANQPWPWPSSLMIGCIADAETTKIRIDGVEIAEARWFDRATAKAMIENGAPGGEWAPPKVAIAHHLIRRWLQDD